MILYKAASSLFPTPNQIPNIHVKELIIGYAVSIYLFIYLFIYHLSTVNTSEIPGFTS